jgi:hypothetical protein
MWSKESFYTSRLSRNSLDPEPLMGGWDTLYIIINAKLLCTPNTDKNSTTVPSNYPKTFLSTSTTALCKSTDAAAATYR